MASRTVQRVAIAAVAALATCVGLARGDAVEAFSNNSASGMYTVGSVSVAPPGVPGLLAFCTPVAWSYTSDSDPAFLATVNLVGTFFVWNVTMQMSVSGCENANGGGGSVTGGSISGNAAGGSTLSCSFGGGSYTRQGVILSATIASTCSTDGVGTPITFDLAGTWVPNVANLQGVLAPITDATLAAAMVSVPS
jgi:hypothetical protein